MIQEVPIVCMGHAGVNKGKHIIVTKVTNNKKKQDIEDVSQLRGRADGCADVI